MTIENKLQPYQKTIADRSIIQDSIINIMNFDPDASDKPAHRDYIFQFSKSVLQDVIFNFPENYQVELNGVVEDFKAQVSNLEAKRLSSEERQAIKKYAEDCDAYKDKYGEDPELAKLMDNLEEYRQRLYTAYLDMGDKAVEENKTKTALEHFDEAIELYTDFDTRAWNRKAQVYFDQKNYNKALEFFNAALKLDPKDALAFGQKEHITRNRHKAVPHYEKGVQLFSQGKYKPALKKLTKANKLSPGWEDFQDSIDKCQERINTLAKTQKRVLNERRTRENRLTNLGLQVEDKIGSYLHAGYSRQVSEDMRSADYYYSQVGDQWGYEMAELCANRALGKDPNCVPALAMVRMAVAGRGYDLVTYDVLGKFAELVPQDKEYHLARRIMMCSNSIAKKEGLLSNKNARKYWLTELIHNYSELLTIQQYPSYYLARADAYSELGQFQDALSDYETTLKTYSGIDPELVQEIELKLDCTKAKIQIPEFDNNFWKLNKKQRNKMNKEVENWVREQQITNRQISG